MTRRRAVEVRRGARVAALACVLGGAQPALGQAAGQDRLGMRLDSLFAPYQNPGSAGCAVGVARAGRTVSR